MLRPPGTGISGDREAATKRAYPRPAAARLCDGRFLLLQPADGAHRGGCEHLAGVTINVNAASA